MERDNLSPSEYGPSSLKAEGIADSDLKRKNGKRPNLKARKFGLIHQNLKQPMINQSQTDRSKPGGTDRLMKQLKAPLKKILHQI